MEVLLARQSILDRDLEVLGYELLFRDPETGVAAISDGDQATSAVVSTALLELGLETVVGDRPAFLNVTRQFLLWDTPLLFDRSAVVFEIVDADNADFELVEALGRLKANGYRFCADLSADVDPADGLLEHLTYAKFEISGLGAVSDELSELVGTLEARGTTCIATRVETREQLASAKDAGFNAFQGFFLHRPDCVRGQRLPQNKVATLQLLTRLHDPDVDIVDITEIITADPGLSHRVLQIAGATIYGGHAVDSIDQAIMRIGLRQLREWLTMLSLSAADDRPSEVLSTALLRARMCAVLAPLVPEADEANLFTVGLLSYLDVLMNAPLDELLAHLPLTDDVSSAILEGTGPAGSVLQAVAAHLAGDWDAVSATGLPASEVSQAWMQALQWVEQARSALVSPKAAVA